MSSVSDSISDDGIMYNDDTGINMDELHGSVSNIIVMPDRESGYSSQESQEPPEPMDSRISEVPRTTSNITQMYNTTNDKFKKVTIVLAHGLIYNEDIGQHHEIKFLRTAEQLTYKMREDSPTHFNNFVIRLRRAFQSSQTVDPTVWFALSFEELIKKVGESPSWRTFSNMLNCIYIIKEVAAEYYNTPLKTSMEKCLIDYILDHFRLFITSCGGWEDLIEFWRHIEKMGKEPTGSGWLSTFVPAAVGVVGVMALLRR